MFAIGPTADRNHEDEVALEGRLAEIHEALVQSHTEQERMLTHLQEINGSMRGSDARLGILAKVYESGGSEHWMTVRDNLSPQMRGTIR